MAARVVDELDDYNVSADDAPPHARGRTDELIRNALQRVANKPAAARPRAPRFGPTTYPQLPYALMVGADCWVRADSGGFGSSPRTLSTLATP